jgi:hypothetical protein
MKQFMVPLVSSSEKGAVPRGQKIILSLLSIEFLPLRKTIVAA